MEMLERRGDGATFTPFNCKADRTNALAKCFDYFAKVASVITDLEALKESTLHVLEHFAAERCIYLELRTSPKQFKVSSKDGSEKTTTKLQYLETVREAIDEFHAKAQERFGFVMEVKVLLSVDRGKVTSKESALAQIDDILVMHKEHSDLVVGIDICGNPHSPTVKPYLLPALLERSHTFQRLPITFHTAEILDDEESELIVESMRKLNVRRLGHVTYLPDKCRERIQRGIFDDIGVGIEICPTSNMITKEIPSLEDHHFLDWWKKSDKILLSVNTDDVGLFSCDLSSEIYDLASAFHLSRSDVVEIQRQAILSAFHPDTKQLLRMFDDMLSSSAPKAYVNPAPQVNGYKRQKLNGLAA
ncbi:MAPDA [Symbiodinium pilosum]|uniref:MAPDA protein n=1 Tax=Symbiodinium pilosum TaxID=2952 RepID=A0A812PH27_SYMPI|nr:MAPDA [Symbiodinium pilosum]